MSDGLKRAPPPGNLGPLPKRAREGSLSSAAASVPPTPGVSGQQQAQPQASQAQSSQALDPDQLSDALLAAGVDLKEEESLLSISMTKSEIGPNEMQARSTMTQRLVISNLLDSTNMRAIIHKNAVAQGIQDLSSDRDQEILTLLSLACEEWLAEIITSAAVLARHRRQSRNDVHSSVSKALRSLAIRDKNLHDKAVARKAMLAPESASDKKAANNEDVMHRAANATATMMSSGKKKYSWMTGGGGGGAGGGTGGGGGPGSLSRQSSDLAGGVRPDQIRYREAREEPGIALRDLLAALEEKRYGVEKALVKGYSRMKN